MRLAQTLGYKMHGSVYGSKMQCINNTPNTIYTTMHTILWPFHLWGIELFISKDKLESIRQKATTCPVKAVNGGILVTEAWEVDYHIFWRFNLFIWEWERE